MASAAPGRKERFWHLGVPLILIKLLTRYALNPYRLYVGVPGFGTDQGFHEVDGLLPQYMEGDGFGAWAYD
jgi:hypothetical protein